MSVKMRWAAAIMTLTGSASTAWASLNCHSRIDLSIRDFSATFDMTESSGRSANINFTLATREGRVGCNSLDVCSQFHYWDLIACDGFKYYFSPRGASKDAHAIDIFEKDDRGFKHIAEGWVPVECKAVEGNKRLDCTQGQDTGESSAALSYHRSHQDPRHGKGIHVADRVFVKVPGPPRPNVETEVVADGGHAGDASKHEIWSPNSHDERLNAHGLIDAILTPPLKAISSLPGVLGKRHEVLYRRQVE